MSCPLISLILFSVFGGISVGISMISRAKGEWLPDAGCSETLVSCSKLVLWSFSILSTEQNNSVVVAASGLYNQKQGGSV